VKNFVLPDPEFFNFKDCIIAGDECVLVTPKMMGVDWNEDNKYFRSSIWRKSDMKLISAGFRAFTNHGEKPDFEPLPSNTCVRAITKVDGSLLIASVHKDKLIVRTRGTVDATQLENGFEIELLKKKYPKAFDNEFINCGSYTMLYEWTTPTNRIVLRESEEPTLWLIGIVYNPHYSYAYQYDLDRIANQIGVLRPKTYNIDVNSNIENLQKQIEPLVDIEGVVIYSEDGQILKKIKTLRYLQLHRVFTGVKTVDHLFDLFVEYGQPSREDFEKKLADNFDWELVTALKSLMDDLFLKWKRISTQLSWMQVFLNDVHFMDLDRKNKARKILEIFPNYAGIAFSLLDSKILDPHKLWKTFE